MVEKELKMAKGHLAKGEKQRALLALRRKKFQESLLEKTVLQMTNLDELASLLHLLFRHLISYHAVIIMVDNNHNSPLL